VLSRESDGPADVVNGSIWSAGISSNEINPPNMPAPALKAALAPSKSNTGAAAARIPKTEDTVSPDVSYIY
jgi:hypothetical protein